MKYYWICLRADGTVGLFETAPNKVMDYDGFEYVKSECDIEWAETVMIRFNGRIFTMLLDEEGKLNGKPVNEIATKLYNNPYDFIVGDVAIIGYPFEADMTYLIKSDADELFSYIESCSE